jgi:two-component system LytT family response regulator
MSKLEPTLRALVIDDERLARAELRQLLQAHPDVQIVAEAGSAARAAELIKSCTPDLLLLDVQMPGGSGFDLLESLADVPAVIFTTAHDRYALRAFEVSAVDYLLKPVEPERLARALDRARASVVQARQAAVTSGPRRIFVKDGERCWLLALDQVALFESLGNHTVLHHGQDRPVVLRSLNQLEARLDPELFFRASRKHIVNLTHVVAIDPWPNGGLRILLRGGGEVEVSRRQAQELRARLSL